MLATNFSLELKISPPDIYILLTQTQNISSQPPLQRGGEKNEAPLRRGVGEMLAVVILKIEERCIWGDVCRD